MKIFDAGAWIGAWPFAHMERLTPRMLARRLAAAGITRALVSPLGAVLAPSPGPANRELLRDTRGVRGLEPVPVINPRLADWPAQLAEVAADRRVRAVRLLPSYHDYNLADPAATGLAEELRRRGLRLIVQVRLIDERHEFHAMELSPVPLDALTAFLRRHPRLPVLAAGLLRAEILALGRRQPRLVVDLGLAEWFDTVADLTARVPGRKLVLASQAPLLVAEAARARVATTAAPRARAMAVAAGNLERWLGRTRGGR